MKNSENYICIFRWMHSELMLSEKDEKVYAYIYGITKDGESICTSSHSTMAEMCNCAVSTVKRSIENLEKKGLIRKETKFNDKNVSYCKYWVVDVEKNRKEGRRKALMKEAEEMIKKKKEINKKKAKIK